MNDLISNNTKPKNIIVLVEVFKQIIGKLCYNSQSSVPKE